MTRRVGLLGLIIALLGSISILASSATAVAAKSDTRSIDEIQASDEELAKGIAGLDRAVATQQAAVTSAQQALDAANQALADEEARIAEARAHIEELRAVAAERAVQAYMNPQGDMVTYMLTADGFGDASRRSEILEGVAGRDAATMADLKGAKRELDQRQKEAEKSRKLANERKDAEQAKLDELNKTRSEQLRLRKGLADRLATYAAEDSAGAAETASSGGRANRGSPAVSDDSRISAAGMQWPVAGPVRSPFGPRWGSMHSGIDIGAREGTPMYAAKGGTVKKAGWDGGGYGNLVTIDHGGGLTTYYGHMSKVSVRPGQSVSTGQLIGNIGHTGRVVPPTAAAAHVHFETRVNGSPRNPMNYLP